MTELHPDPIGDSGQKVFQYVQLLAMAAEAVAVIMAARGRAAAERDQQKADAIDTGIATNHKAAADLWAPVLADHQRDSLDVAQILTAWSAAQGWQAADPDAQRAAVVAEERLHELRPAAMMRYDDLRSQGLDPVAAMRQVVPLLDTNPRIGETSIDAHALTAEDKPSRRLEEQHDLDAGRLPDTAATRVLADELDREHDGDEQPRGLSGYELTYGGDDQKADVPHRGWDSRAVDDLHQDLVAAAGAPAARIDEPWAEAPTASPAAAKALASVAPVDAASLLVAESALLTRMQQHRLAAAQDGRVASGENLVAAVLMETPYDPATRLIDERHDGVRAAQPHVSLVSDAGAHAHVERDAAQALTASYPIAVRDAPGSAAAAPAFKPASTVKPVAKPTIVRS